MSKYSPKSKPKTLDIITFNNLFFNNHEACRNFFFNVFHPLGFVCPDCGYTHFRFIPTRPNVYVCKKCSYQMNLFAGTIFQDNKLPLYTLLLGIFLFVTAKKSISAEELANTIGTNRKSAQLLCRKIRYLMQLDNSSFKLESTFIEVDAFFVGAVSHNGKRGNGTDKQPMMMALGTDAEDNYPNRVKIINIESENKKEVKRMFNDLIKTV